jgi:hypothetical protein
MKSRCDEIGIEPAEPNSVLVNQANKIDHLDADKKTTIFVERTEGRMAEINKLWNAASYSDSSKYILDSRWYRSKRLKCIKTYI